MTDMKMGPLDLSVLSYASDDTADFEKANWLLVKVACPTDAGDVAFQSSCLMTTDIFDFMDETDALLAGEGYHAYLVSLEPQVDVQIARGEGADSFTLDIELTPNAQDDEDIYGLSTVITRADLEGIATQTKHIIDTFPVRALKAS
jgi:hypothetical protein